MGLAPATPPLKSSIESAPTGGSTRARLLLLKAIVTFALLGYLVSRLEWAALDAKLRAASLGPLLLALVLILIEIPMAAFRWMLLARRLGANMTYRLALQLTFAGLFFGQVLPASIGGDVVRGWLGARNGLDWPPAIASLVLDRVIALLAAVILIVCALPWIADQNAASLRLTAQVSVGVVLVLLAGLFIDRVPLPTVLKHHRLVLQVCNLIGQTRQSLFSTVGATAMAVSLVIHGMTILAVSAIAAGLGISDALTASAIVVPIALVAAAIPISVNGWGVREGVMVAGFALFGIAQGDAFLISVLLGLSAVLASLPGGFAWLTLR